MSIHVFHWNVLTQAFCNFKEAFLKAKEHYSEIELDEEWHRGGVLNRIHLAMLDKRVIVLHEVDCKLCGALTALADRANYGLASQG